MNKGRELLLATSALLYQLIVLATLLRKSSSSGGQTFVCLFRIKIPSTIRFLIKIDFWVYRKWIDKRWKWTSMGIWFPSKHFKNWTVSKDDLTYTYKLRKRGSNEWLLKGKNVGEVKGPRNFVWVSKAHRGQTKSQAICGPKICQKAWMIYVWGEDIWFSTVEL